MIPACIFLPELALTAIRKIFQPVDLAAITLCRTPLATRTHGLWLFEGKAIFQLRR
jgi:hypothetical protein